MREHFSRFTLHVSASLLLKGPVNNFCMEKGFGEAVDAIAFFVQRAAHFQQGAAAQFLDGRPQLGFVQTAYYAEVVGVAACFRDQGHG